MIDFACACGFKTQIKDEWTGRKLKCPNCGQVVALSGHKSVAANTSRRRWPLRLPLAGVALIAVAVGGFVFYRHYSLQPIPDRAKTDSSINIEAQANTKARINAEAQVRRQARINAEARAKIQARMDAEAWAREEAQEQFEITYQKYRDMVAAPIPERCPEIQPTPSAPGTYGNTPSNCEVLRVLGRSSVLIIRPKRIERRPMINVPGRPWILVTTPELIFYVIGVDTEGLVNGATFRARLLRVGRYQYSGKLTGAYAVPAPLAREDFAEALAGGLQLVSN